MIGSVVAVSRAIARAPGLAHVTNIVSTHDRACVAVGGAATARLSWLLAYGVSAAGCCHVAVDPRRAQGGTDRPAVGIRAADQRVLVAIGAVAAFLECRRVPAQLPALERSRRRRTAHTADDHDASTMDGADSRVPAAARGHVRCRNRQPLHPPSHSNAERAVVLPPPVRISVRRAAFPRQRCVVTPLWPERRHGLLPGEAVEQPGVVTADGAARDGVVAVAAEQR